MFIQENLEDENKFISVFLTKGCQELRTEAAQAVFLLVPLKG